METDKVTDPAANTLAYVYDTLNGDREIPQTDALGATMTFGYDVDGFQDRGVEPNGDYSDTGLATSSSQRYTDSARTAAPHPASPAGRTACPMVSRSATTAV